MVWKEVLRKRAPEVAAALLLLFVNTISLKASQTTAPLVTSGTIILEDTSGTYSGISSVVKAGYLDRSGTIYDWTYRGWLLYTIPNLGQVATASVRFNCTINPDTSVSWSHFHQGYLYYLCDNPLTPKTISQWNAATSATKFSWLSGAGMSLLATGVGSGGSTPTTGGSFSIDNGQACLLVYGQQGQSVFFGIRESPEATGGTLNDDSSAVTYQPHSGTSGDVLTISYAGAPGALSPSNGSAVRFDQSPTLSWENNISDCGSSLGYRIQYSRYSDFSSILTYSFSNTNSTSPSFLNSTWAGKRIYWRVQARNKAFDGANQDGSVSAVSAWSSAYFDVSSESVSTPTNLSGSTSGRTGQPLNFAASGSSCNYDHSVEYLFNWGDGSNNNTWGGATQTHSYGSSGSFAISVKARCATHTAIESGWSGTLKTVTVSYNTLTLISDPPAGGTAAKDPNNSGYSWGQQVTCTATPASGYEFVEWNGGIWTSTDNPVAHRVYGDETVYASFRTVPTTRVIRLSGDLSFGDVTVNSSAQRPLTIYNDGNATLSVSSITYPAGFTGSWSGSISAGGSRDVTVTFSPTAAQSYSGTVTVGCDKTSGTNTIACSGAGVQNPTISGRVTRSDNSQGMDGVTVTFSNSGGSTSTSGGGYFSRQVSSGWSGIATPSYSSGSFSPLNRNYTDVTSDQSSQNFSWTPPPGPTISGRITRSDNGQGLDGVSITFSNSGGTTSTSGGGYYSNQVSSGWSGTATPSYAGGTFIPPSRSYTSVTSNQTSQDYVCTISGTQYYVNDTSYAEPGSICTAVGNDSNDGTAPSKPKRTIQALLNAYPDIGTDVVVNVDPGTYTENITIGSSHSGLTLQGAGAGKSIIDGNQEGACLAISGLAEGIISGFTLQNGESSAGGGIACHDSSLIFCDNAVLNNSSIGSYAGGICLAQCYSFSILRNVIDGNTSNGEGGGIVCIQSSDVVIEGNTISNNTCEWYGGGIDWTDSSGSIVNNLIYGNAANIDAGGGISLDFAGSQVGVVNNTVVANTAQYGGGIGARRGVVATVINCIVWGNDAPNGPQIGFWNTGGYAAASTLNIRNSNVHGGQASIFISPYSDVVNWGTGNINLEPHFLAAASHDYRIDAGSPCIDAGDGDVAPTLDMDGNARVDDSSTTNTGTGTPNYVDIGAYEYQPEAPPPPSETVSEPTSCSGPTTSLVNRSLTFTVSGSSSSAGHGLQYCIDWGDDSPLQWGPYYQDHSYAQAGIYNIIAKACCDHGEHIESDWSDVLLTVTITEGIVVVQPSEVGEVLQLGTTYFITWDVDITQFVNGDKAQISLLCDGVECKGMGLPKKVKPSQGQYKWKLPKKMPKKLQSGNHYMIRISRVPTKVNPQDVSAFSPEFRIE